MDRQSNAGRLKTKMYSFKQFKVLLFCIWMAVLGLWVSGCEQATPTEASADRIRVGTTTRLKNTNPVGNYGYSQFAMLLTHDTLVRFDSNFLPYGQLAEKWVPDSEGRTWSFWLKPDLTWHDGTPLTSRDVKFTFEYLVAKNIGGYAWLGALIHDMVVDGNRITFHLNSPYARFLENAGYIVRILPRHIWQDINDPHKAFGPELAIGSGPYLLDRFDEAANIVRFVRNAAYPQPLPHPRMIDFYIFTNYDTLALALASNKVDVYYRYGGGFPPNYLKRLQEAPNLSILQAPAFGVPLALGFNMATGPARMLEVRQAISLAIDYEQINRSLLAGTGMAPTAGFVPPSLPGFQPRPPLAMDLPRARELLQKAGFDSTNPQNIVKNARGEPLVLRLIARNDLPNQMPVIRILQHGLAQIGIDLQVRTSDLSTWVARVSQQDFDLLLFRTTTWGMLMGAGSGTGYFDGRRQGGGCIANVQDPDFFALCDSLLATTEIDPIRHLQGRIQDYYAARLPAVALCWGIDHYPHGNQWSGYSMHPMEGGVINRLSLQTLRRAHPVDSKEAP